jgi:hypothetical protein
MPLGYTDPPPPTQPTTEVGALGAAAAPGISTTMLQNAQYQQQLGNLGPQLQTSADELGIDTGLNLAQLGINAQQSGLSQLGSQQQYQLQQQAFQQQAQENQFNYQNQLRNTIGGAAASGVLGTTAAQTQESNIGQQAQFANENLQRQALGSAQQQALAQQNFGLIAQANGISQQEVWNRLSEGLNQMGINADPSQLVAQLSGGVTSANQQIAGVVSTAGLYGNLNANAPLFGQ